jgi:hypothetical protein
MRETQRGSPSSVESVRQAGSGGACCPSGLASERTATGSAVMQLPPRIRGVRGNDELVVWLGVFVQAAMAA